MLWLLLCCLCYYPAQAHESYTERLSLVPLNGGQLLTRFEFRVGAAEGAHDLFQWGDNADCTPSPCCMGEADCFGAPDIASDLIPRSISSLVRRHSVGELHLGLVSGRWQHDQWGPHPFQDESPPGSELWAWLQSS
jgi:hypothetical protein